MKDFPNSPAWRRAQEMTKGMTPEEVHAELLRQVNLLRETAGQPPLKEPVKTLPNGRPAKPFHFIEYRMPWRARGMLLWWQFRDFWLRW